MEERVDIVVTDKVAGSISTKLKGFAKDARAAHKAISDVQAAIAKTSSASRAADQAAAATVRQAIQQQRLAQVSTQTAVVQERLAAQIQRTNAALLASDTAVTRSATAQQQLLAASARASIEQQRLAEASARAAQAQTNSASATARLAAAQAQANAAQAQATAAQSQAAAAAQRLQAAQTAAATATTNNATAQQRLTKAQADAAAAQTRASTAAQQLAASQQRVATATAQAAAAQDRAALAALRLKNAQEKTSSGFNGVAQGMQQFLLRAGGVTAALALMHNAFQKAEAFTRFQNGLRLIATSEEEVTRLTQELLEAANRAKVPLESVGTTFQRINAAIKSNGGTQKEAIQITESLTKAIANSSLTTSEQASALLQVSQAFNKGKLDGDEFRSVMENFPQFADELAKSLGVANRSALLDLAPTGIIRLDAMREAAINLGKAVDNQLVKPVTTVDQSLTKLSNSTTVLIGSMDRAFGVTSSLARAFEWLAEKIEAAAAAQNRSSAQEADFLRGNLAQLDDRIAKQQALINAGKAGVAGEAKLNTLLKTRASVLNEVAAAEAKAQKERDTQQPRATIQDLRRFDNTKDQEALSEKQLKAKLAAEAKLKREQDRTARAAARPVEKIDQEIERLKRKENALETATELARVQADIQDGLYEKAKPAQIEELVRLAKRRDELNANIATQKQFIQENHRAAEEAKNNAERINEQSIAISEENIRIREQIANVTASEEAWIAIDNAKKTAILSSKITSESTDIENEAIRSQIALLNEQTRLKQLQSQQAFLAQNSGLQGAPQDLFAGTDTALKLQQDLYAQMYERIRAMRENNIISAEAEATALARIAVQSNEQRLQNTQEFFTNLAQLSNSGSKRLQQIGKAAAVAQATIDGILAVQKALAAPPGWPYNAPNVIAVGVVQAANVAKIAGFQSGGYTGNGAVNEIAGVTHGQEFVVNADGTAKNRSVLERMNAGETVLGGDGVEVNIFNYGTSKQFEVERLDENRIRVIARDEAETMVTRKAPEVIAADMGSSPNSRTSKAVMTNFNVTRNRG